jgi:hypothetical protein
VAISGIKNSGTSEGRIKNATLIAGPTASGKSALALELAERDGGVIVNADSMQVYGVLDVLTARPSADDLTRVRHFLYGHVSPATAYSTGNWLRDVAVLADSGLFAEKPPDVRRRHRALFSGARRGHFGDARNPSRDQGSLALASQPRKARRGCIAC